MADAITVSCPSCRTTFPVDPAKVPEGGVNARCSECQDIFWVETPLEEVAPEFQEPGQVGPTAEETELPEAGFAGPPEDETVAIEEERAAPPEEEGVALEEEGREQEAGEEMAGFELEEAAAGEEEDEEEAGFGDYFTRPERDAGTAAEEPTTSDLPTLEETEAAEEAVEPLPGLEDAGMEGPELEEPGFETPRREPTEAEAEATEAEGEPIETEPEPAEAEEEARDLQAERPRPTFGNRSPEEKAQRLARVLVSDMITYNPTMYETALARGSLKEDFADEIEKSWEEYVEQVGEELANSTSHWTDALNDILAKGEKTF